MSTKLLGVLGYGWLILCALWVTAAVTGIMLETADWWPAIKKAWAFYSPFSPMNFLSELLGIAPGLIALYFRQKRLR